MKQNDIMAAIEVFKTHLQDCIDYAEYGEDDYNKRLLRANDIAIQALEKQVAKLPTNKVHEDYKALGKNYYCVCGVMFLDWENQPTNYCGNCGQRLKS